MSFQSVIKTLEAVQMLICAGNVQENLHVGINNSVGFAKPFLEDIHSLFVIAVGVGKSSYSL